MDANTLCTVQLSAQNWETVLVLVGKGPYENVHLIIQSIVAQVMRTNEPVVEQPANDDPLPGEAY